MQLCLGVEWKDAEEGDQEDNRAEEQGRAKPNLKHISYKFLFGIFSLKKVKAFIEKISLEIVNLSIVYSCPVQMYSQSCFN